MSRIFNHVRHNVIAYVALFVALGGTTYAATGLPRGSVGTKQLRNSAVTPPKLDHRLIGGYVRAWAVTNDSCQLVASSGGAKIVADNPCSPTGGALIIAWRGKFLRRQSCVALGVPREVAPPGSAQPVVEADYLGGGRVAVSAANPRGPGQGVTVALVC